MNEETPVTAEHAPNKLDDVLLAMDVVDTLRHRDQILLKELDAEGREDQLIDRLREIYTAQGIDVPDHVLKEGVRALEERRFHYDPPKPSFAVRLARIYVSRDRWLKPVTGALAASAIALGAYQFGYARPAEARAKADRVELTQTLPRQLQTLHQEIQSNTNDLDALALSDTYLQDGNAAVENMDKKGAQAAFNNLKLLQSDLNAIYEVRVVYGPNVDRSGVFRIPDDAPLTRNYYLIVEAIDPAGRKLTVPVRSEEDGSIKRTDRWGQRVSKAAFSAVADDKNDDQIIQNATIGEKAAGGLRPEYRVETPGGAILEW